MGETEPAGGFAAAVAAAVSRTSPLCAGIDPSSALLERWGLPDSADGLASFGLRCVEAFAGVVPVVKPQVAFFERWGAAGLGALETVMAAARQAGLLVIADAKRADIGSTMEAYASAWLDPASPLVADAVTVVPYLGIGALAPAFDLAAASGRGVIVVVRSSNPEGRSLQEAVLSQAVLSGRSGSEAGVSVDRVSVDRVSVDRVSVDRVSVDRVSVDRVSVEDSLLQEIADLNHGGLPVPGTVGAVIGATLEPSHFELAGLGGVILAPGLGAQGGTAAGAARLFSGCPPHSVLANVSRTVLAAGPDQGALTEAARVAGEELNAAFG